MSMNLFPYVYVYGPVLMDQQNLKTFSKHGNNNLQLIGITFSLQEHGGQWGISVLQMCKKWPYLNIFYLCCFHPYLRKTNLQLVAKRDAWETALGSDQKSFAVRGLAYSIAMKFYYPACDTRRALGIAHKLKTLKGQV